MLRAFSILNILVFSCSFVSRASAQSCKPISEIAAPTLSRLLAEDTVTRNSRQTCSLSGVFQQTLSMIAPELGRPTIEARDGTILSYSGQLKIHFYQSQLPNAFAVVSRGNHSIHISSKLMSIIEDPNELAYVLSHEYAHIRNRHFAPTSDIILTEGQAQRIARIQKRWEIEADLEASKTLRKAGIPIEFAEKILHKISQNQPNQEQQKENKAQEFLPRHLTKERRIAMIKANQNNY